MLYAPCRLSMVKVMIKAKAWKENDLEGKWEFERKIDGVRMLRDDAGRPVSRNLKPLFNLDGVDSAITDAEIFTGAWETTVTAVKKQTGEPPVKEEWVYSLYPEVDKRLKLGVVTNPTAATINKMLETQVALGDEGLILRSVEDPSKWLKVKTKYTADVRITGLQAGGGKYVGVLGAFMTNYGNVGTGLTDAQRAEYNNPALIGSLIEVEYMELTNGGKFRHPRFVRFRTDKDEESFQ